MRVSKLAAHADTVLYPKWFVSLLDGELTFVPIEL